MRVLALSNFYPPYNFGGEELSAQAIVDGLRKRGHDVEVVTSAYGKSVGNDGVYRQFKLEMEFKALQNAIRFFTSRKSIIRDNIAVLQYHVQRFRPDLILIFSLWNIPRHVPALAEKLLNGRVVYRLASYWPVLPSQNVLYWQSPAMTKLTRLPKAIMSWPAMAVLKKEQSPALQLKYTVCISKAVHDEYTKQGVQLSSTRVIHNGIDTHSFFNDSSPWLEGKHPDPLKLLYVGRTSPEKGVHTALEALAMMKKEFPDMSLTIAGSSWGHVGHSDLIDAAAQIGISDKVEVQGHLSHDEIPRLMKSHHVLLVPSIWPEPFGRVVLEGMAAGMVVIGTAQGGMAEILKDEETGLVFPPENAPALSRQIKRLLTEGNLGSKLVRVAQNMVSSSFTEDKMVDAYEAYLIWVLEKNNLRIVG
jgi:glycosyltransferase involved in cell wall biosynthesis